MQLQTLFGAGWLTYLFLTPGWAGEIKAGELSSLTHIVDEAVRSNPEIHAAKKRAEAIRAKAKQATYLTTPSLTSRHGSFR